MSNDADLINELCRSFAGLSPAAAVERAYGLLASLEDAARASAASPNQAEILATLQQARLTFPRATPGEYMGSILAEAAAGGGIKGAEDADCPR